MNILIEPGTEKDIGALALLYDNINDFLTSTVNYPGWAKGVYPTAQDAECGVRDNCLFTAKLGNILVGSIILREEQEPAYSGGSWRQQLTDNELFVIHTLVVNPEYLKMGIGQKLLAFAGEYAAQQQKKALRLDVYEKNTPAISLYEKCGFVYSGTVSLGLESRGLNFFRLYEKQIPEYLETEQKMKK